jgi:hypothetical protein
MVTRPLLVRDWRYAAQHPEAWLLAVHDPKFREVVQGFSELCPQSVCIALDEADRLIEDQFSRFGERVEKEPAGLDRAVRAVAKYLRCPARDVWRMRLPEFCDKLKSTILAKAGADLTATTDKREAMAGAANESVDAKGEVTNPRDPTAYVLASVARLEHTPAGLLTNHRQLVAVLSGHPEIKRWHPRKNRLCVHLADWTAFVKKKTEQRDAEGLLTNPDEIAARTAEVRRKKSSGK